jgi:hypothetical protein
MCTLLHKAPAALDSKSKSISSAGRQTSISIWIAFTGALYVMR